MNPWTALLESLHSAVVDELTERCPETKPGLGMPLRQREFAKPEPSVSSITIVRVDLASKEGLVILGLNDRCATSLGASIREVWNGIQKRSGREFEWRRIRPVFLQPVELVGSPTTSFRLPEGCPIPARVIWIPFLVGGGGGKFYLGVGA